MEKEKAEKEKDKAKPKLETNPIKTKHSKPDPAKPPFAYFKEEHEKWENEKIKEEWGKLPTESKEPYTLKAKQDKERYKKEMEEYNKTQEILQQQKAAGGGDRQKRGKR